MPVPLTATPDVARFAFSLPTCNGCHFNETHTRFHHIEPREAGSQSAISSNLSGEIVSDWISGKPLRLHELTRRQTQLEARTVALLD